MTVELFWSKLRLSLSSDECWKFFLGIEEDNGKYNQEFLFISIIFNLSRPIFHGYFYHHSQIQMVNWLCTLRKNDMEVAISN